MKTTLLSERLTNALLEPSLAALSDQEKTVQLTERFWKEDNPDTLREPPSIAYEIIEGLIEAQKRNK